MRRVEWRSWLVGMSFLVASMVVYANGQSASPRSSNSQTDAQHAADALKTIDKLVQQNRELMEEIAVLRRSLEVQTATTPNAQQAATPVANQQTEQAAPLSQAQHKIEVVETPEVADPVMEGSQEGEIEVETAVSPTPEERKTFGNYTPGLGFTVANTDMGSMNISILTYARYLNQLNLAPTYTNAFGVTSTVQQRQDFQLAKLQIKFLGWILNPKLRYFLYAWTSNANMGQGAQVVLAGNLNYQVNKYMTLSAGINGLPGVRSIEGNFPYWLSEDSRLIADEFFRPSYTSGIWSRGQLSNKIRYQAMLGDNLSQLGVNAGQLRNYPNTFSSALVWMPSTGEFGAGFGDFENHEKLATRLGFHFTRSREDKQSQPGTQDFQNVQLRLSDGSIIFTPNLFGPGITITNATYKMTSFDGGIKYQGYALEGEYYLRWLTDFRGSGAAASIPGRFDHGFQLQASSMLVPKTFQIYAGGSTVFGQYGQPFDSRIGWSWFPFHNRVVRWNTEALYLFRSPVGYFAVPFNVGSKGWVFHSNWELAF